MAVVVVAAAVEQVVAAVAAFVEVLADAAVPATVAAVLEVVAEPVIRSGPIEAAKATAAAGCLRPDWAAAAVAADHLGPPDSVAAAGWLKRGLEVLLPAPQLRLLGGP